jgi:hypothetical protein
MGKALAMAPHPMHDKGWPVLTVVAFPGELADISDGASSWPRHHAQLGRHLRTPHTAATTLVVPS